MTKYFVICTQKEWNVATYHTNWLGKNFIQIIEHLLQGRGVCQIVTTLWGLLIHPARYFSHVSGCLV